MATTIISVIVPVNSAEGTHHRCVASFLTACDCLVSSSRQEVLPINHIEATASGKYIIAIDVRGNADVVRQSGYGILVALNDDEAMAAGIKNRIYNDKQDAPNVDNLLIY